MTKYDIKKVALVIMILSWAMYFILALLQQGGYIPVVKGLSTSALIIEIASFAVLLITLILGW